MVLLKFFPVDSTQEILYFENYDLDNIVMPVDADKLDQLLTEAGYNQLKKQKLVDSFRHGFDLGYRGNENVQKTAPNLKLTIGTEIDLWNKVMKEVKNKRYAGPYKKIPFDNYIQSPIGLVSKDGGQDTRLIFHLSYPHNGRSESVNACTPTELSRVKYKDFDQAIRKCLQAGVGCKICKSYMKSAFRNLGISRKFW